MTDRPRPAVIRALCLAAVWAAASAALGYELHGRVTDEAGQPLAGALVVIESAGPRAGRTLAGPWCHPDCGKFTVTAADGKFTLDTVQSLWLFTLHVEARGFMARVATADVRAEKPAEILMVAQNHPNCRIAGEVLLPDGSPAVGATINVLAHTPIVPQSEPFAIDEQVQSDAAGRFVIHSEQPLARLDVKVDMPGTMDRVLYPLQPGDHQNTLRLASGATVRGRVLYRARPASGVQVAMTPLEARAPRELIGSFEATTDDDGVFTFEHVLPQQSFRLYTRMESLSERNLAAIGRPLRSPAEGHSIDVVEMNLHPAHRIRGFVATHDDKSPPPSTRIIVERIDVLDSQSTTVDSQGYFELSGIPSEPVALSVVAPGYKLSALNESLDSEFNGAGLIGRVDDDLPLIVMLGRGLSRPHVEHRYYYERADFMRRMGEGGQSRQLLARPLVGLPPTVADRLGLSGVLDR